MAIDTEIQNGITFTMTRNIIRDSSGNLYAIYLKVNTLYIAYSLDGGLTWQGQTQVSSAACSGGYSAAIDSGDVVHIVYCQSSADPNDVVWYTYFSIVGGAGAVTQIGDGTIVPPAEVDIAVNSVDDLWVVWNDATRLRFNKKESGSWTEGASGSTAINTPSIATDTTDAVLQIAIDSNDYVHVLFQNREFGSYDLYYTRYETSWLEEQAVFSGGNQAVTGQSSIVIDSSDNVHAFCIDSSAGNVIKYAKYTASTSLWGAATTITTSTAPNNSNAPAAVIDSSDTISLFYSDYTTSTDMYIIQNVAGVWGSDSKIIDMTSPNAAARPQANAPIYPIIDGVSTQRPSVGYHFSYFNTGSELRYYASTDFTAPLVDKNYSSEANNSLPSTDSNLSDLFTSSEYSAVLTVDGILATQSATDEYSIFEFKNKGNSSSDNIVVTWIGQSNIAPTTSTVYLQIYNRTSGLWETLDSNSTAGASANFSLSGTKTTSLSDYYNGSNWVSCRVYQQAI